MCVKGLDKPSGTRQWSIIILFLKWSDIQDNAVSTFESYCLGLLSCLLSLCSQSTSFLRRPFTYTHLVFLGPWVGKPEVSLSGTLFSITQQGSVCSPKDLTLVQELCVSYSVHLKAFFTSEFGTVFHRTGVIRAWFPVKRAVTWCFYSAGWAVQFLSSCSVSSLLSLYN